MNIEKHRAFLDSLEGEKGLPGEMHGWRFDRPLSEFSITTEVTEMTYGVDFVEYLAERCRRAESRQIPDLKERVKELVRDAMDAENKYITATFTAGEDDMIDCTAHKFRALCKPTKPEVKQ